MPWKNAATLRAPSILAHLVYIALWPGDIRLNYNARRSLHSRNDASTPPFSFFKFLADHPFSFARSISSILAPLPSFTVSLTVPNLFSATIPKCRVSFLFSRSAYFLYIVHEKIIYGLYMDSLSLVSSSRRMFE